MDTPHKLCTIQIFGDSVMINAINHYADDTTGEARLIYLESRPDVIAINCSPDCPTMPIDDFLEFAESVKQSWLASGQASTQSE